MTERIDQNLFSNVELFDFVKKKEKNKQTNKQKQTNEQTSDELGVFVTSYSQTLV